MTEHLGRNGFNFPLLLSDLQPAHLETPTRVIVHRVRCTTFSSSDLLIFSAHEMCDYFLENSCNLCRLHADFHFVMRTTHYTRTDHELFNTVPRPFCTSVNQLAHGSPINQTLLEFPPESSDSDTPRAHITTTTDHLTRGNSLHAFSTYRMVLVWIPLYRGTASSCICGATLECTT